MFTVEELFEKRCNNEYSCMDNNHVKWYGNASMYLASINAYNEGKKVFYGSLKNGKFVAENPNYEYILKNPLTEKEYLYLKKRLQ